MSSSQRRPLRRTSENSMDLDKYPRRSQSSRGSSSSKKKKRRETLDPIAASSLEGIIQGDHSKKKRRETIEAREAMDMSSALGLVSERRETIDPLSLHHVRERLGDADDFRPEEEEEEYNAEDTVEGSALALLGARLEDTNAQSLTKPSDPTPANSIRYKKTAAEACRALLGAAWGKEDTSTKEGRTGFEFASAARHVPLPTTAGAQSFFPAPPRSCLKSNPRRQQQMTSPTVRFQLDRSEIRTFHDDEPSTNLTPVDKSTSNLYVGSAPEPSQQPTTDPRRMATVANSRTLAQWKMSFDQHPKLDRGQQPLQERRRASGTFVGISSDSSSDDDDDDDEKKNDHELENNSLNQSSHKEEVHQNFDLEEPPLAANGEDAVSDIFLARQQQHASSPNTTARLTPIDETMEETPVDETVQLEPNLSALLSRTQETPLSSTSRSSSSPDEAGAFALLGIEDTDFMHTDHTLKPPCQASLIPEACRPVLARVLAASARTEADRCIMKANSLRATNTDLAARLLTRSGKKKVATDDTASVRPPSRARLAKDLAARLRAEAAAIDARAAEIEAGAFAWTALEADAGRLAEMANAVRTTAIHSLEQRCTHLEQRLSYLRNARDDAQSLATKNKSRKLPSEDKRLDHLSAADLAKIKRQLRAEADIFSGSHAEAGCWRRLELAEGVHGWRLRALHETELLLALPHALFGDWAQVQVSREHSLLSKTPRLLITRTFALNTAPSFHFMSEEHGIAFQCLKTAPANWLHPRARQVSKKRTNVSEILLSDIADAPTALERLSFFASRLENLARELYMLDVRCGHNAQFRFEEDQQSALLQIDCVASETAQISIAFRIRRGYPDPAARASATLLDSHDSNDLLALALRPLRGPDAKLAALTALQALNQRGFIDSNLPAFNISNNDHAFLAHAASGIPAAMPGPGAILDMTVCVFYTLGLDPLS